MTQQPTHPATSLDALPPGRYAVDPQRSEVSFRTRHLFGLGTVTGRFGAVTGHVEIGAPVHTTTGALLVDATGFDSGDRRRDAKVHSRAFLDTAGHPHIAITVDGLETDADGARAVVPVTVRGTAAPVAARLTELAVDGELVSAVIEARVDRYAHGVTAAKGLAARYLDLTVRLVATPA